MNLYKLSVHTTGTIIIKHEISDSKQVLRSPTARGYSHIVATSDAFFEIRDELAKYVDVKINANADAISIIRQSQGCS